MIETPTTDPITIPAIAPADKLLLLLLLAGATTPVEAAVGVTAAEVTAAEVTAAEVAELVTLAEV